MRNRRFTLPVLVLFLFNVTTVFAQPATANAAKEAAFSAACKAVVDNFYKVNVKKLNALVDPKAGVYVLFRPGAIDAFRNVKKLDTADHMLFLPNVIAKPDYKKRPLQFGNLPAFDCDNSRWSKTGFIADSSHHFKPVTDVASFRIKYEEQKISKKELAAIKGVEGRCRKIIYALPKGEGIVFYLAWSGSRWYLAIIDNITTDCSA
jgi:hypothetical protein